jgi:methyl-accepting chemotaxis protein
MKRNWRRRNYFIKKELQGKYIFTFFLLVLAGSVLFTAIFSFMSADTMTIVYKDSSLRLGRTPMILSREILGAHWLFIVIGGLLVVVLAMFMTHRFAGPMYRLEKSVEEMIRGNFNFEIRLRAKDEAKELAAMMNELNTVLSERLKEIKTLTGTIGRHIEEARNAETANKAIEELDRAIALNAEIGKALGGFKLKNDE